jgi:hypothetical protein
LREAHPLDGWAMKGSKLNDPRTQADRELVANQCCRELKFDFPAVVDTMDDQTAVDWAAWPERIFVVGVDGRVAYAGEQGPWGFWPTAKVGRQSRKIEGAEKMLGKKLKGESLEEFLERLFGQEQPAERVEPLVGAANVERQ